VRVAALAPRRLAVGVLAGLLVELVLGLVALVFFRSCSSSPPADSHPLTQAETDDR